jgi:DNA-binding transcriptional LysR family regulator
MAKGSVDWDARIGRRLRLRDLHVFFAVVRAGSMAKAASQLRVTQPSVSKSISDLESMLGVPLFDRNPRGVVPTMYGNALLRCGAVVFDELRQGIRTIESLADPDSGELRIGCLGAITATMILPTIIKQFARRHPRAVLHIDDVASPSSLLSGLRDRKYDLTIARSLKPLTDDSDDLQIDVLLEDRMVIAAGTRNRWASRRKTDLAEIVEEQWILSEPDTWNYARLREACEARGLPMPKGNLVSLSVPLRAYFIANGPYIAPFAEAALPLLNAQHQSIKALPVDLPDRPWPILMATLKGRTQSPLLGRFMATAHSVVKSRAHLQPSRQT